MGLREEQEQKRIRDVRHHMGKASKALRKLSDLGAAHALGDGSLNELLVALVPPINATGMAPYEFFQKYKHRTQMAALLRRAIQENYSVRARLDNGAEVYISPCEHQWKDDGVIFLQGAKRSEGLFCLLGLEDEPEKLRFGIAARDISPGGKMGADDIRFVSLEEIRRLDDAQKDGKPRQPREVFARAIEELRRMISAREEEEAKYQAHLQAHPWMLGLEYESIESHRHFDDRNIPDFTGIRARDSCRDIIEIKPPFLDLFKKDDSPSMEFMANWHQAERYLDFARNEHEYLRRQKGIHFENPKCFLLIGVAFSEAQQKAIRIKENNNPSIKVLTYFDLIAYAEHTLNLLDNLSSARAAQAAEPSLEPNDAPSESKLSTNGDGDSNADPIGEAQGVDVTSDEAH